MAAKTIVIKVKGAEQVPLDKLEPFQGDLKTLERAEYEKLRQNIIENGFSFTPHIWKNKGQNWLIDGHQRVATLTQMRDEGYKIPSIPVSIVSAKTIGEAKLKVLAATTSYGKMTEASLAEFVKQNNISYEDVASSFTFPEIDMEKFMSQFDQPEPVGLPEPDKEQNTNGLPSSSEGVKQINLFFSSELHDEFMKCMEVLAKKYKTENITDTVMGAVREAAGGTKKK